MQSTRVTFYYTMMHSQSRSQALSSPERKTLAVSGHVTPRFWVVTNKIIEHVRLF